MKKDKQRNVNNVIISLICLHDPNEMTNSEQSELNILWVHSWKEPFDSKYLIIFRNKISFDMNEAATKILMKMLIE